MIDDLKSSEFSLDLDMNFENINFNVSNFFGAIDFIKASQLLIFNLFNL